MWSSFDFTGGGREKERSDRGKDLVLNDPLLSRYGIKPTFSMQLDSIYLTAGNNYKETIKPSVDSAQVMIYKVKQDHKPWSQYPILRKLIFASRDVFIRIQKTAESNTANSEIWKNLSVEYRYWIRMCYEELEQSKVKEADMVKQRDYSNLSKLLFDIHLIWQLCEILFLEKFASGDVVKHLLVWLRWHVGDASKPAIRLLGLSHPEEDKHYWNIVYSLILQGHVSIAMELISLHTESGNSCFQQILALMSAMPFWKLNTDYSATEFHFRWQAWKQKCFELHKSAVFSSYSHLDTISRILAGDESVFASLLDICHPWYHLFVSKMLYCNPTVNALDLAQHAKISMRQFYGTSSSSSGIDSSGLGFTTGNSGLSSRNDTITISGSSNSSENYINKLLMSALEQYGEELLKECCVHLKNWWLVVHLSDLLYHASQPTPSNSLTFREYFILEYASGISSTPICFSTALTYFKHCPLYGEAYIRTLVEHHPLHDHSSALKMMELANDLDIKDVAQSMCKTMVNRSVLQDSIGMALVWAIWSRDEKIISSMAEKYIDDYLKSGCFGDLDLLDHLQANMLYSDTLTFLGEYRRFHRLMEDELWPEAGQLLVSLIPVVPAKFQMMVLTDALELLGLTEKLIFDEAQTYELMKVLEDIYEQEAYPTVKKFSEKVKYIEGDREKIDGLREALARNLARAVVE